VPHIVHWAKFYPPEWGGMETITHALAVGSRAAGYDVSVVAFTKDRHATDELGSVEVVRCRAKTTIASQPLSLRYVVQAIRRARTAEVVHIHFPNLLCALPLAVLPRRAQVILHWHSDIVGKGLLGRFTRPVEKWMAKRADIIIATSENYAAASPVLGDYGGKVAVVPLGIDDVADEPKATLPDEIETFLDGRRFALAVGRLVPYKGFDCLIEAAVQLPRDIAIIIVGGGPCEAALRAAIDERGLTAQVKIVGTVSRETLNGLFGAASVYVMSSIERSEAFGVVLLEAMAHGLPIVATDIPGSGVPWVAQKGKTGPLVRPRHPRGLADAIVALFDDTRACAIYGRNSRTRFKALFTKEAMISQVLGLCAKGRSATSSRPFARLSSTQGTVQPFEL
jgi:glycosyltransferase involved in cell wall biosynthesis